MTQEEIRLQVAISVIQGVLEAKHGVIGEVVPSVAVAIALRIADAFVEEWYRETEEQQEQPDLKEELKNLIKNSDNGCSDLDIARHFAKWGAEHLKK